MKRVLTTSLLALALSVAISGCNKPAADATRPAASKSAVSLKDEKQLVSYMVGLDLARNVQPIRDEIDLDIVDQAMRTALAGEKPLLDKKQADAVRQRFTQHLREKRDAENKALAEKNQKLGDAFFAENTTQPGVKITASGLQYQELRAGKGAHPKATDAVRVDYVGTLLDGTQIDSTYATDHSATLALNQVMPGWSEGVQLMTVGSKYKFWVPAKLAYGEVGKPGEIEPNAPLVFEVELQEIAGQ
jgi:FKBP-type peptidyl-prolyl cis-trans isomerase FkpA/FKBP-type peptidyl-prolyl cis-trans isomerase FklB